jgi:protein-L-isoaspartate(D-aspartate) O-methyltransferase
MITERQKHYGVARADTHPVGDGDAGLPPVVVPLLRWLVDHQGWKRWGQGVDRLRHLQGNRKGAVSLLVSREPFIPDLIYVFVPGADSDNHIQPFRREDDPEKWLELVHSDEAIATVVAEVTPGRGLEVISSSSAPSVMEQMISALDLKPGMKVLEIGTGTGFNAACLAALGADVVSVEIDPAIANQARSNLLKAGYDKAEVICGDGGLGAPASAPFDRVIVTAGTGHTPYPWIEQTKEGGKLVVPYSGEEHEGAMLVMTVSGGIAKGTVEGKAYFMPMRGQRLTYTSEKTRDDLRVEVGPNGQRFL